MVVEVSLKHIPMRAVMSFDAATEGVTGRLLRPARRCPTHGVSSLLLRTRAIGYPRSGGRRRTLLSPRRTRLCSRRTPSLRGRRGAQALETGVMRLEVVVVAVI